MSNREWSIANYSNKEYKPSQFFPSPVYPGSHTHAYDPGAVSVHVANSWQSSSIPHMRWAVHVKWASYYERSKALIKRYKILSVDTEQKLSSGKNGVHLV